MSLFRTGITVILGEVKAKRGDQNINGIKIMRLVLSCLKSS